MRPVDGILLDGPGVAQGRPVDGILVDPERQPFKNYDHSDSEDSNSGGGDDTCFSLFLCCCCCCFCLLPIVINVMVAFGSIGFTSCPQVAPNIGSANTSDIPASHSVITPHWDWNIWYKSSNVFDPMVSNETRVGYWRTAKTWYLRDVWAYVPEGADVPGVIAWQPFFSWTTTYDINRCFPPTHHIVSRDVLWFWSWGESHQQWSIKTGDDREIAKTKKY
jgi:hypothetical protein